MENNITFIKAKAIRLVFIALFVFQNIVQITPGTGEAHALQVQSKFNPIAGTRLLHENIIEASLRYILKKTEIEKFRNRLSPLIHEQFMPIFDFSKKYPLEKNPGDKKKTEWVLTRSITDPESGQLCCSCSRSCFIGRGDCSCFEDCFI